MFLLEAFSAHSSHLIQPEMFHYSLPFKTTKLLQKHKNVDLSQFFLFLISFMTPVVLLSWLLASDQLPQTVDVFFSKKSGKLKTGYKREYVNLNCDVDFEGPIIHAAAVLGYEGWLAGYQMAFDTAKSKLAQNNFALGYRAGDFQLHTNV